MKTSELINFISDKLDPDANISIIWPSRDGKSRVFEVVNASNDQLGGHLIIESKSKLMEDALPECGICGKKLRNPRTRKEFLEQMYCHPPFVLRTCWDKAAT